MFKFKSGGVYWMKCELFLSKIRTPKFERSAPPSLASLACKSEMRTLSDSELWTVGDSNSRPPHCKCGALPTKLTAQARQDKLDNLEIILDKSIKIKENKPRRAYGIVVTCVHGMDESRVRFSLGPPDRNFVGLFFYTFI